MNIKCKHHNNNSFTVILDLIIIFLAIKILRKNGKYTSCLNTHMKHRQPSNRMEFEIIFYFLHDRTENAQKQI